LGHNKNDPHQKLESLERWSARATLLILLGIVIEIGLLLWFPHDPAERLAAVIANALIGVGLAVEYIVILRAVVAGGEATRLSDEKIAESNRQAAEANQMAAEANLELARLRMQLAARSLTKEQFDALQELRGKISSVNVCTETDSEPTWFGSVVASALV
jgi:ribosomal protein L29